jgi:hypothetical protein
MIAPFHVEKNLQKLVAPHPSPEDFRNAIVMASRQAREDVVRLWLTEGIPFSFRSCPAIYERIRFWVGQRLEVCPKEITVVGSARIGFSMAGGNGFGRVFSQNSDLDLAVVSEHLFESMTDTFERWKGDHMSKVVSPRNPTEEHYWTENIKLSERNMNFGFMDANKLPTLERYPLAQKLNNTMWALRARLEVTAGTPVPRKASVRVYRSWRALVERVSLNLLISMQRS